MGHAKGTRRVQLSTLAELSLGAVAGALAQLFILPMSIVATRQQVAHKPRSPKPREGASGTAPTGTQPPEQVDDHSFFAVAKDVYDENGVTGFWSGLKPSLILCINPALTYGAFERMCTLPSARSANTRTACRGSTPCACVNAPWTDTWLTLCVQASRPFC